MSFTNKGPLMNSQISTLASDHLYRGQNLPMDKKLTSTNGRYKLVMQSDGNLVLYCNGNKVNWASNTAGKKVGNGGLQFQLDGNLVIYDPTHKATWWSKTHKTDAYALILSNNGNLELWSIKGTILWQSNTAGKCG